MQLQWHQVGGLESMYSAQTPHPQLYATVPATATDRIISLARYYFSRHVFITVFPIFSGLTGLFKRIESVTRIGAFSTFHIALFLGLSTFFESTYPCIHQVLANSSIQLLGPSPLYPRKKWKSPWHLPKRVSASCDWDFHLRGYHGDGSAELYIDVGIIKNWNLMPQ